MANFKTPYTFVAGTKAKASEVNENFSAIKDELNKKQDKTEDGYITIKDAIQDDNPISKSQFDTAKEELKTQITKTVEKKEIKTGYLFNSGNATADIQPDLLDIEDNTKVVFKVDDGTNYKPLIGTLADGETFERLSIPDLNISSLADGTYNLFVGKEGSCIPLANTILIQKNMPLASVETPFEQPVLSKNGTLGGNTFAVGMKSITIQGGSAGNYNVNNLYIPFGSSTTTRCVIPAHYFQYVFYNPTPISCESIILEFYTDANAVYRIINGTLKGSNDYESWETITTYNNVPAETSYTLHGNDKYYKYYMLDNTYTFNATAETNYVNFIPTKITLVATKMSNFNLANNVWLNTSSKPYVSKKHNGTTWETFDYVPLPQNITVKDGVITSIQKCGNYNDNGWDNYIMLPNFSKSTVLTNGETFKAPINGWIFSGTSLVKPLFTGETFTPTNSGYIFYAMKGE